MVEEEGPPVVVVEEEAPLMVDGWLLAVVAVMVLMLFWLSDENLGKSAPVPCRTDPSRHSPVILFIFCGILNHFIVNGFSSGCCCCITSTRI